jgi:hypothetical protein
MNKKHVVEAIALALILLSLFVVWYNLTYREMTAYIEDKPYQEFGIETSHDEYIDNRPQGRYTKSGIRILPNRNK